MRHAWCALVGEGCNLSQNWVPADVFASGLPRSRLAPRGVAPLGRRRRRLIGVVDRRLGEQRGLLLGLSAHRRGPLEDRHRGLRRREDEGRGAHGRRSHARGVAPSHRHQRRGAQLGLAPPRSPAVRSYTRRSTRPRAASTSRWCWPAASLAAVSRSRAASAEMFSRRAPACATAAPSAGCALAHATCAVSATSTRWADEARCASVLTSPVRQVGRSNRRGSPRIARSASSSASAAAARKTSARSAATRAASAAARLAAIAAASSGGSHCERRVVVLK